MFEQLWFMVPPQIYTTYEQKNNCTQTSSVCMCVCLYLSVHQCIIEQYEPVVGEAPGVLQSQRSVAAFAHHTTLSETQILLMKRHKSTIPRYNLTETTECCTCPLIPHLPLITS